MAEHRVAWQVRTTNTSFGFVLWLGGRQLHCAFPNTMRNLVRGWFAEYLGDTEQQDVRLSQTEAFMSEILPRRLTGLMVSPVDLATLPSCHSWLATLEDDRIPTIGEWDRDGWRSNRWDPGMDVPNLLKGTREGRYRWAPGEFGGFKGGGRDPNALEMWVNLAYCGGPFALVIRRRWEILSDPIVQADGWMSRSDLHRLWDQLS